MEWAEYLNMVILFLSLVVPLNDSFRSKIHAFYLQVKKYVEGKAIYFDAFTDLMNVLQIYTCILQMGVS